MKMRSLPIRLALAFGLAAAGSLSAAEAKPAKPASRTTVNFEHPEKYADVRETFSDNDNSEGAEHYLPLIREHLQKEADRRLADGQQLTITFTDIDLAGDFEPWRGVRANDIRIIKDIYVPRMEFSYKLTDASGQVVKEGKKKLTDLAYQMRMSGFPSDTLRYEKEMLNDWLKQELPTRKS